MSGSPVAGVTLHELPEHGDERGRLVPVEWPAKVPFVPQRLFVVRDVPAGARRGRHAHRRVHQFLVCVQGGCTLRVDDGRRQQEIRLDSPRLGVHLSPMVWAEQHGFSPDAVLLVLASEPYDADEYERSYDAFLASRRA